MIKNEKKIKLITTDDSFFWSTFLFLFLKLLTKLLEIMLAIGTVIILR